MSCSVLLSLKVSTISLLITVNYKCKGQHSEKKSWAECCKLENCTVRFPQQKHALTALYMGVWRLELWVNQTWCFRHWKVKRAAGKFSLLPRGTLWKAPTFYLTDVIWHRSMRGKSLCHNWEFLYTQTFAPRDEQVVWWVRHFPMLCLGIQAQEASCRVTSLHGSKTASGEKGLKPSETPKCLSTEQASLFTPRELISLKLCPVPHIPLPLMVHSSKTKSAHSRRWPL